VNDLLSHIEENIETINTDQHVTQEYAVAGLAIISAIAGAILNRFISNKLRIKKVLMLIFNDDRNLKDGGQEIIDITSNIPPDEIPRREAIHLKNHLSSFNSSVDGISSLSDISNTTLMLARKSILKIAETLQDLDREDINSHELTVFITHMSMLV